MKESTALAENLLAHLENLVWRLIWLPNFVELDGGICAVYEDIYIKILLFGQYWKIFEVS